METKKRHIGSSINYDEYKRIPTTDLHSKFDGPQMWKKHKMRLLTKKNECGCYKTKKKMIFQRKM